MSALVFFLLVFFQPTHGRATDIQLGRISSRLPVEPVHASASEVAGVYGHQREDTVSADSSQVRTALYLFPDGTYLFVQRASIMPATIFDKGHWKVVADVLEVSSARDVTWNPDLERKFLILRRTSHPEEFLLVGTDLAVKRFERLAGNDAEGALMTVARKRKRVIEPERSTRLKDYLMRKAWHPERFGDEPSTSL
jgi:hypothetical protein